MGCLALLLRLFLNLALSLNLHGGLAPPLLLRDLALPLNLHGGLAPPLNLLVLLRIVRVKDPHATRDKVEWRSRVPHAEKQEGEGDSRW